MVVEFKIHNPEEGGTKSFFYDYSNGKYFWHDSRWTKEMIAEELKNMANEIINQD